MVSSHHPRGSRVRVWYATTPDMAEARTGVVSAAEEAAEGGFVRMYVSWDGIADGAWVDGRDDWEWDRSGEPRLAPGSWPGPGFLPGAIEKVHAWREEEDTLLVKWTGLAHIHCQWVPREALLQNENNIRRVSRYLQERRAAAASAAASSAASGSAAASSSASSARPYPDDFEQVEAVLSEEVSPHGAPSQFLVKWRGLPHSAATWEDASALASEWGAVEQLRQREAAARAATAATRGPPDRGSWAYQKLAAPSLPGGRLREYQLEGVNWLLYSWHARRNVLLADEMGLGKTAQSVALLGELRRLGVQGPFLVVAPLSTLEHWQREVGAEQHTHTFLLQTPMARIGRLHCTQAVLTAFVAPCSRA